MISMLLNLCLVLSYPESQKWFLLSSQDNVPSAVSKGGFKQLDSCPLKGQDKWYDIGEPVYIRKQTLKYKRKDTLQIQGEQWRMRSRGISACRPDALEESLTYTRF